MTVFAAIALALCPAAPSLAMYPSAPLPSDPGRPPLAVIIDPGHGGDDLGAIVKGLQEKDVALAVSLKLRDRLQKDLPVRLTRDDDRYVPLEDRLVDATDWNGAMFVSIHLNKIRSKRGSGVVIYSYGRGMRLRWRHRYHHHRKSPPMPAPPKVDVKEGSVLADSLERALRRAGFRVERAKSDYYVLKNPSQPSVLIEIGYLSNPTEAANLKDPAYQDKLVEALTEGIEAYAAEHALHAGAN